MGTFNVDLWVGNLFVDQGATVRALVDTGSTHAMMPASLLNGLGIAPVETRTARVADGRRIELQTAWARFAAGGRNAVARVAFGPEGEFLMGATTLEDLGMGLTRWGSGWFRRMICGWRWRRADGGVRIDAQKHLEIDLTRRGGAARIAVIRATAQTGELTMPTLDFKGKQHIYAHHLTVPYRPLVPDTERSLNSAGIADDNLIIHGDNLHALKALLPRYAGRVKCIYIDPPYNTGNEGWVYNDKVNSPLLKEWFKHQSPVDGEDLERHDKWLCMMWPRLHLLKDLLSDDGVIFISIDDNEQHHLRMLLDEIFGPDNFIDEVIWRKKAGGGQDATYFANEHEYILCYRKTDQFAMRFRRVVRDDSEFPKEKNGRRCKYAKLEKWGAGSYKEDAPTLFYPITDPDGVAFLPKAPDGKDGRWRKHPTALDDDHIHWERRRGGRWTPYEVIYQDESNAEKIVKDRTIFYNVSDTTAVAKEQRAIFGSRPFDTGKPVDLVTRLASLATGSDDIVLDSFSGSGTTAHAVLSLNNEDGGNRKFILVECQDYADTITAERVRRVIRGVPGARDKALQEGLGGSFTYCTLGEPIDAEGMLTGQSLPEYSALAAYLLHTATGLCAAGELQAQNDDGLFYGDDRADYYLLYRPSVEYLQGNDGMLNEGRARRISDARRQGRRAIVFGPGKYIGQRDLSAMGITFCQLPYEMHQPVR